jgi:hypothetical protein
MVMTSDSEKQMLIGSPDITKEISEVFERYYIDTGSSYKYAESFLDAWLNMQKEEAKIILYRKIQAKDAFLSSQKKDV